MREQPADPTRPIGAFYSGGVARVDVTEARGGAVSEWTATMAPTDRARCRHLEHAYRLRLREIEATARTETADGYRFQVAEVNASLPGPVTVHVSTYRSSVTGNPGNAAELAFEDNRRIVYVSSLGQGCTSVPRPAELRRFARTGSLITDEAGNVDPLPVVSALAGTLSALDLQVSSLRSDSSGRALISALAVVLPVGSVEIIFQNAPPNIGAASGPATVARLAAEDLFKARSGVRRSPDCDRVDAALVAQARREVPALFQRRGTPGTRALPMAVANYRGLARSTPAPAAGAAFRDLRAALRRQHGAVCGLVFGALDPLFMGVSRADLAAASAELSTATTGPVRCVVLEDARHSAHAWYPHFYRELERRLTARAA